MDFLIADTFTDSLGRLTSEEQKLVKTTAFDLQVDPAGKGNQFHRVDKVKDKNFWSVRVGRDIRLIVHKMADSLLLCYVDHHDKAYAWAQRRKLQTHPRTGAAQLVEIRETVQDVVIPNYVEPSRPRIAPGRRLLDGCPDEMLLDFGVPEEWLSDVRSVTEDTLFDLMEHLPAEAAEAVLEWVTVGHVAASRPEWQPAETACASFAVRATPSPELSLHPEAEAFEHPDARRRFRIVHSVEELAQALDYPWDKWTVFLHPEQRSFVERDFKGPARVSGSAGTGKTIVALHRAAYLARKFSEARVLLTTFSDPLARSLQTLLNRLLAHEPRLAERIDVHSIGAIGKRLYRLNGGKEVLVERPVLRELILGASSEVTGHKFSPWFLTSEWEHVVDAWQLESWEAYRDVARLGRKTRLPEAQRKVLWGIFERVQNELRSRNLMTESRLFSTLARSYATGKSPPFDCAVMDESQDVSVAQLRFLASLGANRPNVLFFAGDLGQRIFQQPFSWKSLGVDVVGRSRTLRVNYRTSHQIRLHADRLLGPAVIDVDGNSEDRSDVVSVFNGPPPSIRALKSELAERKTVADWLREQLQTGVKPHEIGIFVRSAGQLDRAKAAAQEAGVRLSLLDNGSEVMAEHLSISTMHLAKGLEFRAVVVMACDDEIIPLQERIESVGDDADLKEVYDTERHLLYVACTRARDALLVTSVEPASEFLDDLEA